MLRLSLAALSLLVLVSPAMAAGRPMTIDDLLAIKSVSDPQISPDGKSVVYVVSEIDRATDKTNSDLWLVPAAGGEPKRLTTSEGTDNHPRWRPDGKEIAFVSSRGGSSQVWLLPIDGGEARPLTKLPIDVSGPIWSPKGDQIAFVAEVYPGKSPEETAARDKEKEESKSKVRIFDRLMIRHWSTWDEGKRSHLFVADARTGEAKDLTPKLEVNTPPAPFGGSSDYAFSPDGKELAFTAEPTRDMAWSTNTDIWTVPTEGGEPKNLSEAHPGADAQPSYSPDGKSIAWLTQARAGFESDQWVLTLHDREGKPVRDLTSKLDRPVLSFTWSNDGRKIFAVIDDEGTEPIVAIDPRGGDRPDAREITVDDWVKRVVTGGVNTSVQVGPGGENLVFVHASADRPAELYRAGADGSGRSALTRHNDPLVATLDLPKLEGFTFSGADGDKVAGWLLRPPGFEEGKSYPVVFLIHGGPQGAWHDEWHGRWNYQMFAAPGYAVVAINPAARPATARSSPTRSAGTGPGGSTKT